MATLTYPIRLFGDPVLRRRAQPLLLHQPLGVPGFAPVSLKELSHHMLETMFEANGAGLAAPQVGLPIRLFVAAEYKDDTPEGRKRPLKQRVKRTLVAINPQLEILDPRKEAGFTDGCLSIPGVWSDHVQRPLAVRLHYTNLEGQPQVEEAEGLWARVLQHEFDHLEGKLFLDYLPKLELEPHRKALAEMQREAKAYLKQLK